MSEPNSPSSPRRISPVHEVQEPNTASTDHIEDHPLSTNPGKDTTDLHTALSASMATLSTTEDDDLAKALELSKAEASLHSESVEAENIRREAQHKKDLELALQMSRADDKAMRESMEAEERRHEEELRKVIGESLLTGRHGVAHGNMLPGWGNEGESSKMGAAMGEAVQGHTSENATESAYIGDGIGEHGHGLEEEAMPAVPPASPDRHNKDHDHEHDHHYEPGSEEPEEDGKGGITV